MTNKKEAAVLAHRDLKEVRGIQTGRTLTTILPRLIYKVKRTVCQTGCLFFGLMAFEFFFAPIDPGDISLAAGWTLAAVSGWLALTLGRLAGELGGEQR